MTEPDPLAPRHAARLAAVQALYQMELSGADASVVIGEFVRYRLEEMSAATGLDRADEGFFADIVKGVVEHQRTIDQAINGALAEGWRLPRLDAMVRALLRAAVYELTQRSDVPPRVAITEYLNLAHAFYEGTEPGFVNAVLDAIARSARSEEMAAK